MPLLGRVDNGFKQVPRTSVVRGSPSGQDGSVGLLSRLNSLDQRVLGARSRRFDAPVPRWHRYAFAGNLPLVIALPLAVGDGGLWWLAVAVGIAVMAAVLIPVGRWERAHKIKRQDEFDIAVDRML